MKHFLNTNISFTLKKKFQSPDTMINYSKINEESAPDNQQNNNFLWNIASKKILKLDETQLFCNYIMDTS